MVINPYRLPVNVGRKAVRGQIVNSGQILINNNSVPIIVGASVSVNTENSGLTLSSQSIDKGEKRGPPEETKIESFATVENPDWLFPPDAN